MAGLKHYDALTVARELVLIGAPADAVEEAEAVYLCPLRLQKLLYYCQGWGLALLGRPLFRQPLCAWKHGPVVCDVYSLFKGRSDCVRPDQIPSTGEVIDRTSASLVGVVWREYSRYTPRELVEMTHREPAWKQARGGLPADALSDAVLDHGTMRDFFAAQAAAPVGSKPGFPSLTVAEVWAAEEAFERSGRRTTSAADFRAELSGSY